MFMLLLMLFLLADFSSREIKSAVCLAEILLLPIDISQQSPS